MLKLSCCRAGIMAVSGRTCESSRGREGEGTTEMLLTALYLHSIHTYTQTHTHGHTQTHTSTNTHTHVQYTSKTAVYHYFSMSLSPLTGSFSQQAGVWLLCVSLELLVRRAGFVANR